MAAALADLLDAALREQRCSIAGPSEALDGAGLLELWPYLLGMTAWAALAYVLAARTFRTE